MSLIRNEQTKLTATWMNAISVASIAVGGFAQLAPLFSGVALSPSPLATALLTGVWFGFATALHLTGRWFLRRLEE